MELVAHFGAPTIKKSGFFMLFDRFVKKEWLFAVLDRQYTV